VVTLGELMMILELHRQGLSLAAIARRTGMDRATVAKYVKRGLEPPCYGPRHPRPTVITPVEAYLRERVAAFPELNGSRLLREIRERGYTGGYTALKDFLRTLRPRRRRSSAASRPRRVSRPRSISPISEPPSPTSPAWSGSSGYFPWCSATAA
jgi:transposase